MKDDLGGRARVERLIEKGRKGEEDERRMGRTSGEGITEMDVEVQEREDEGRRTTEEDWGEETGSRRRRPWGGRRTREQEEEAQGREAEGRRTKGEKSRRGGAGERESRNGG